MQVLIGNVTADAKVTTVKDNRQVVNFSIAINDQYKPKDKEVVKVTTYINCSYWKNPGIAEYLKKGALVELIGRLGVNPYTSLNGEAKASITLHVDSIKLHASTKQNSTNTPAVVAEPVDDLPF